MVSKRLHTYLLLAVALLLFASCSQRKLKYEDWDSYYQSRTTLPYGTYLTYNMLDSVFPSSEIRRSDRSINEEVCGLLNDEKAFSFCDLQDEDSVSLEDEAEIKGYEAYGYWDIAPVNEELTAYYEAYREPSPSTMIIISSVFPYNSLIETALCAYAGVGNTVFLSVEDISESLMKHLSLKDISTSIRNDSVYSLTNQPIKKYVLPPYSEQKQWKGYMQTTSFVLDSLRLPYEVLGVNQKGQPSYIKIHYGFGFFYLHTAPRAFTNITMLDLKQYEYGFKCLAMLPNNKEIYWNESIKNGLYLPGDRQLLKVVFREPALRWGFVLMVLGLLLFMLFRGKREQRIIPVIKAPKNASLDFLDTLSNMFYKKKDYESSLRKRHQFLLEFIRSNYYMDTETVNERFYQALSAKSTVPIDTLRVLFEIYEEVKSKRTVALDVFLSYNEAIEVFYLKAKNK